MMLPSEGSAHNEIEIRSGNIRHPPNRCSGSGLEWFWCCVMIAALMATFATAQVALWAKSANGLKLDTGKEIYMAGCASCHGPDGKGQSQNLAGFERPSTFPDFSDCHGSTAEPDLQWRAVITNGGPARGFSTIMPAFGNALSQDQIGKVIEYVRSLCTEKGWPRGNFNLPLPLVTEKAFPEDEVVLSGGLNLHGPPGGDATVLFEKRIGPSSMIEARVPYNVSQDSGTTRSGFGDIGLGYKRKVFDNLNAGSIFSVGGEVLAPTGNPRIGTGGGSPLLEAYVAYGQILPASSFLQFQTGYELSTQPDKVPRAYFVRTAIGKTFMTGGGLGRWWTPMTEFIADRDLVSGARTNWDVLPEIQIPLSKRLHIRANIGVRIPVNNTSGRPKQLLIYFLWDYADGTLKQGW
jgi:mono/diheme cytochrome c family protein